MNKKKRKLTKKQLEKKYEFAEIVIKIKQENEIKFLKSLIKKIEKKIKDIEGDKIKIK